MVLARWGRNCIELCIACNWVELYFELKIYLFKRIMNNDEINLSSNKSSGVANEFSSDKSNN